MAEWYGYRGEYRFRTSLAPAGTQIETEDNNAISQSNSVAFTLAGNSLSATTGGYVAAYDAPGDYFNLGNLAAGTQVTANLRLPSTSTLAPALTLFKANGTAVTPDTISPTQLVFTLTASDAAAYHLRVTDTAGRGLMAEYFVDLKVEDVVAPTIVSDTLPAEGSSANFFGASFTLNFSEDMLFPTVRETANYELLASGGDGDFTSGNEQIYTLAPAAYSSGLSNSYTITDGPMQPDVYRFTAKAALRDKLDNPLAADYVRTWTITGLAGFVSESRSNNTRGTADRLSVNVLAGEADGSFQDRGRAVATAGWPFDVELADLDGDTKLDAVVTHLGTVDGISIRPGNGDRTFGVAIEFPGLGDEPYDVHLLKVDEDNKLDLAVLVPGSDKVAFFRNTSTPGSLAFVREADVTVGDEPYRLASADLNGDTYMDLVVSNHGTNASSGRCVSVLINNQSGGFTESKLGTGLTPRIRPWAITLTDFNGDAKADLVAGDMDNGKRLALWLGNGDGSFGAPSFTDLPDNPNPADFAVADFNGDGKKDLAYVAHDNNLYDLSVLPGNGDGSFGARVSHYMGYGYYCHFIRTADLDEDGSPDLVFGGNDHLTVATNRGDGSFGFDLVRQNRGDTLNTSHGDTYGVAAGDLNGDGILELVATDHSDSVLRVFDGLPKALLAADDTATNVLHGYGRGFLSDGGDVDFWSFSATRGQVLTVAVDMAGFAGNPGHNWAIYDEAGNALTSFYNQNNWRGQSPPLVIPRDGTYHLRVAEWYGYRGEYRFRTSLAPAGTQIETEDNNAISQSNSVAFTLAGNSLSATTGGYVAAYDAPGDYFNLGNLAAGTQVTANLRLPSTSTLAPALTLFKANGTAVTPDTISPTQLVFTLTASDAAAYHLRVTDTAGRGLMAEYFVDFSVVDLIAPAIMASTLPDPASASLIGGFSLTFNKDMLAATVNSASNYSLVRAGPDDEFGTFDDISYAISPASYASGLSNSYTIAEAPLQPGAYRFTAGPGLSDKFGNLMPAAFTRDFAITGPSGYQTESEPNSTPATATNLVLNNDIPGYLTASGRGLKSSGSDAEYWSFQANAGDRLVFETRYPFENAAYGLAWRLTDPDGVAVFDRTISSNDLESTAPYALGKTGTYLLRVSDWYGIRTEYQFRCTLLRGMDYETEPNGTIGTASSVSFIPINGTPTATTAGFVSTSGQLDYLNLGALNAGQTVFLSVRRPDGSILGPLVSLYSSAGVLQAEANGVAGDDSAEIPINSAGNYFALVRANIGTHGINGDYVVDARVVETSSINFPNLRVTRLDEIVAPGLLTGDVLPISYDVGNVGTLGSGASAWVDRVVISPNAVYGDGDDIQLALIPRTGALAPAQSYTVNQNVTLPQGLPGSYYLMVRTDSGNAVDENLQEGDNTTITLNSFNVGLRNYADLVVADLNVTGPDGTGKYGIGWNLANLGAGEAAGGHGTRVQVVNVTTGQVVSDVTYPVANVMAAGNVLAQTHEVTTQVPGYYVITVTAESSNVIYEYGVAGHGAAEQNSKQANFQIFRFYNIQVAAAPPAGGNVTGGGSIREGLPVTVTATANTSSLPYTFVNWTENGAFVSNQSTYTFVASADRNLVAQFTLPQFLIATAVSPPGSGTVSGGGTRSLGSSVTLTANPGPGYLFDRWLEGATEISDISPLVFTVSANRSITAVFREANLVHAVTFATNPPDLAPINGAGNYNNGMSLETSAPAAVVVGETEYVFQSFRLNGSVVTSSNLLSKTFATQDPATMNYVAHYSARPVKPVVQSIVTNHATSLLPILAETRFTVTFDREMNQAVVPGLSLTSGNASAVPAMPVGSWLNDRTWRSGPLVFTAANGGDYQLTVTLAADTGGRVMNPDSSFGFAVDPLLPLAAPVILPASGTYTAAVSVTMANVTAGSTIYYTTDGGTPDTSSQVYGGAFEVGASATVKARAYKAGHHPSSIVSANYLIDADPPTITGLAWNGSALADGTVLVRDGVLSVAATDNQGIARAEFYYQPPGSGSRLLMGTDTSPGDGLSAPWDVAGVSDGAYVLIARVFDTSGTWSEANRSVSVTLAVPAAPVIAQPASGVSVQEPGVALRIESAPNANIRIFRDGTLIFSSYASSAGVLSYQASLLDGANVLSAVSRNRAGDSPPSNAVTVTRVREFPQLALTFEGNTVGEGMPLLGMVSIPAPVAQNVTVQIATNKASQMESLDPVVIPAGQIAVPVTIVARQDTLMELLSTLVVTVSAVEHRSDQEELNLADDDYPLVTLELDRSSVSENHGSVALTVRRNPVTDRAVQVNLSTTRVQDLNLPAHVEIPANQAMRTLSVPVIDNLQLDGNRIVGIAGEVALGTTVVAVADQVDLEIRDNEGPLLTVIPQKDYLAEGGFTPVTIRREGQDTSNPLTVTLSQNPTGQIDWPATAVIPAGQNEVIVTANALVDPVVNGTRVINLRAGSDGFTDGLVALTVSDLGLAELRVTSISTPPSALTEQYFSLTYQIRNDGLVTTEGQFLERVYLSRDLVVSDDDLLVRQVVQTGNVAAQGGYSRNLTILAPREVGYYHAIVTVDAADAVPELDETNNLLAKVAPIELRAAYTAVVQVAEEIIPTNTPIVMSGSATRDGGGPAPFSMVNLHIGLNGTNRVISAITNSLGQFSVSWNPLRNEGGIYTLGASHPGVAVAVPQDSFEILTMGLSGPGSIALNEGESVASEAILRNPNSRALTGISARVDNVPTGLTITPTVPATSLAAGQSMTLPLAISADLAFSGYGQFPLTVETAEGVLMQAIITVRVELLKPVLAVDRDTVVSSVLRGVAKSESFTVTNTGGLATGPIQVLLPSNLPWLSLASSNPIFSLAPGESASVSLTLSPDATVPLNVYSGNIALNPMNGGSRAVNYRFRTVSDLKGDLEIDVVDELYFFTTAAPKLAGATVTVRDAITSQTVASKETGGDGLASFSDLNEGWYRVEVVAPEHDSHSANYYVDAGQSTKHQIFISKQLVKYSWKVEEVEIEDIYRVAIETTFETNVPAPVVTISPSSFSVEDLIGLGQTKTVNLTLTNHGFIAAQNSKFVFSEHPFYEFLPLVENVGTIPAKSSLVVPVVITRVGVFDDDGNIVTLRGNSKRTTVTCGAGGKLEFNFPCGQHMIEKAAAFAISGVAGNCSGGPGGGGGGYIGFIGGFYGGYGGGGPGGGGTASGSSGPAMSSPDPCLTDCLAKATFDCIIGYIPGVGCVYGVAQCGNAVADFAAKPELGAVPETAWNCFAGALGCAKTAPVVGAIINTAGCVVNFGICYYKFGGSSGGGGKAPGDGYVLDQQFRDFAPEVAEAWERAEAFLRFYELIYGSRLIVLAGETTEGQLLQSRFGEFVAADSDGGLRIVAAEEAVLVVTGGAAAIAESVITTAVARWNRTLDYKDQKIYLIADVPAGSSVDFIDAEALNIASEACITAMEQSRENGYLDPYQEFIAAFGRFKADMEAGDGGACARVKIQLSQDVMMTRTAFRATLDLENQRTEPLELVGFDLKIRDEFFQPSEDLFNIQVTNLTGLAAIDGTGAIGSKAIGSAQWTLIPRDTAAQLEPKTYTIGGTIRYRQGGTDFFIPVADVPITVRPDASLNVKYFHQRDVFSDDPHTEAIEPAEPYKLSVMVANKGYGAARNLKIISGQPKIVDNEKGLFVDFKVIGTEVDGQPLSPSLTADFGQLNPGERKIATWYMVSSLQGLFTEYSATFEHVTGLGDSRLSLMEEVSIHEMIRMVVAQGDRSDGKPDFMTNDVNDANDLPDTIHYSDGGTDIVTVRQNGTFSGSPTTGNTSITLNAGSFSGWYYIRLPDPGAGNFRLASVTRSDGRVLPLDFNAWQTNRTFIGRGKLPRYENILHLADRDSTGIYTVVYEAVAADDTLPPASAVTAMPPQSQPLIPVFWSGSDNVGVAIYDIFVSRDGGAFEPWLTRTTQTGSLYQGEAGSAYAFYSVATDGAGNRETKSPVGEASTSVALTNQAPVLAEIPDQTVNEGEIFTLQAAATDPDGDNSSIRFALGSTIPGVSIDPVTGVLTLNTSEGDAGKVISVIVVARDAGVPAMVANEPFQVTVVSTNRAPLIAQVGPQTLESSGVLLVDVDATDSDVPAQNLVYSLGSAPVGAQIMVATGVITWTPTPEQAGVNHLFTVTVRDNASPELVSQMSFSVTVLGAADRPPVFNRVPVVLWVKGRTYTLSVSASDPDGDSIALGANTSTAAGAVFADLGGGAGSLTWDPTAAPEGVYQIPVSATANEKTANAVVRIRVQKDDLYWNWIQESFGDLADGFDLSLLDMDADPDNDLRSNVHEMAFLTDPLKPDQVPMTFELQDMPPFAVIKLGIHRRIGADQFVDLGIQRSFNLVDLWEPVPPVSWSANVDVRGDDDGLPHTESIDFNVFEYHPDGLPDKAFYRFQSTRKPASP